MTATGTATGPKHRKPGLAKIAPRSGSGRRQIDKTGATR